ncbi:MAG: hypothetical protein ACODAG_05295 [Myxococcota bacterium]
MHEPVVVVGLGQMGGVFSHAFLKAGHPVIPVNRDTRWADVTADAPHPALVLVAVGEGDLHPVLEGMPAVLRSRVGLLQNELLPRDWERHGITHPTVAAVWFEKKKPTPVRVIRPTPVAGPAAELVAGALDGLDIASCVVEPGEPLVHALVVKNLYILTANLAGLAVGGTVGELWHRHRDLAMQVADDALQLQEACVGHPLPREALVDEMADAFLADPDHGCRGRSAPARLERALAQADELGLELPAIRDLQAHLGG